MEDGEIDWEISLASADQKEMFYIPKVLVSEFEKYFNPDTKTVLIPEAEKFVPYLTELVTQHDDCEFL